MAAVLLGIACLGSFQRPLDFFNCCDTRRPLGVLDLPKGFWADASAAGRLSRPLQKPMRIVFPAPGTMPRLCSCGQLRTAGAAACHWSVPDEEVFALINDLHRPIGTYLYGRKNYEMMTVWETPDVMPGLTTAMMGFAPIWRAASETDRKSIAASFVDDPQQRVI